MEFLFYVKRKIKVFKKIGIEPMFNTDEYKGVENVKYKWKISDVN